jgi:uncharacterized protein (TIGR03663 family)
MPESQSSPSASGVSFPWLTIEVSLWALIVIAALGLRLLQLDHAPLNSSEARDALEALGFARGEGGPATAGYSPVVFGSQWLVFLFFGANEFTARLLPALAGAALVLTPALLRPQLGRFGALAAGTLLCLSPTAVVLSRTASGDILVAVGALVSVAGLWRYLWSLPVPGTPSSAPGSVFALLSAGGVALMLTSSSLAYSALVGLISALLVLAIVDTESRHLLREGWVALRATPHLAAYSLATLLGGVVLLSTAFGWHIEGFAAAANLLPQWLGEFIRWPNSLSASYPGLILVLYEPLILMTGLAGTALAVVRGSPFARFVALWSVVALLLTLVRPGRGPGDVLLTLVPLACLSGLAFQALGDGLRRHGRWHSEGIYLLVTLPLWLYLLFNLATYTRRPGQYFHIDLLFANLSLPTFLGLGVVALVLVSVLVLALAAMQGPDPALRALGLSATAALLMFTVAAAWGVSQNRSADASELLVVEPTAADIRLLSETLSRVARERKGDAHTIDLTILVDDPALEWALRDFREARIAEPGSLPVMTSAVVGAQALGTPLLGGDYIGQSFPLRRRLTPENLGCRWNPIQLGLEQARQLDCTALVNWLLFRDSPYPPTEERVVLWLRKDLAGWQ